MGSERDGSRYKMQSEKPDEPGMKTMYSTRFRMHQSVIATGHVTRGITSKMPCCTKDKLCVT
jgi:hypothetical protein